MNADKGTAALLPTLAFAWMNQSGLVCMSKKAGQCISLFDKDYALVSLVYDALKGLDLQ